MVERRQQSGLPGLHVGGKTGDGIDFLDAFSVPVWTKDAVCASSPWPDRWFSENAHDVDVAKAYCESCPVKAECLQRALDVQEEFGIFGGLTPQERRDLETEAAA